MKRVYPILTAILLLPACTGGAPPDDGWFRVVVTSSTDEVSLGSGEDGAATLQGTVTGLGYDARAHRVGGSAEPTGGVEITAEDGTVWAVGWDIGLADGPVVTSVDLDEGDVVSVTLDVVMPFWTEEALVLEDEDGLVLAGVNGAIVAPELDGLSVTLGERVDGTRFEHDCGQGFRVNLDVTGDTEASVPTNASAPVDVDGATMTFTNLGTWSHEPQNGMACLDWTAPYAWVVAR